MKTTFIYALCDPRTELVRYLGKSDAPVKRFGCHLRDKKNSYKTRWIASLKKLGLRPRLEVLDEVPDTQWEFWEREYIRVFRAVYLPLTNTTDGGECPSILRTPEHNRRIAAAHRGRKLSVEHCRNIGLSKLGFKQSEKQKRAASLANSHPKSAETRKRMKDAWVTRKQKELV